MKHILACMISIFIFHCFTFAQNACKPAHKANKGKLLAFQHIELQSTILTSRGLTITMCKDSVQITEGTSIISQFHINGGSISDAVFVENYSNGHIKRIDSLSKTEKGKSDIYFNLFTAYATSSHHYYSNGIKEQTIHYRQNSKDSLIKKWYPSGILKETTWKDSEGDDSAKYEWNEKGILHKITTGKVKNSYYDNGLLKSSVMDTTISKYELKCHRKYYSTGIIESIEYYQDGSPCHNWSYYNQHGALTNTLKMKPLSLLSLPEHMEIMVFVGPEEKFYFVEELAEYPGGTSQFRNYINKHLANTICESPLPLNGDYKIHFIVGKYGTCSFQKIEGENQEVISRAIEEIINASPKWKPSKIQGRPSSSAFILTLSVKNNIK